MRELKAAKMDITRINRRAGLKCEEDVDPTHAARGPESTGGTILEKPITAKMDIIVKNKRAGTKCEEDAEPTHA